MAQADNLPVQAASTALPPMLPTDELVVSIEDNKESIQNVNHTSANVSELTSGDTGEIVNGRVDGSTIVTVTDDRYEASVDENYTSSSL